MAPLLAVLTIIIGGWISAQMGGSIWPSGWPILAQHVLATVVREFFDCWAHRSMHRWHHSRERREADTNYGNAYIFWDAIFGTRYLPDDREPPEQLGIAGLEAFPKGFFTQWISPFRWARIRRESTSLKQSSAVVTK